MAKISSNSLFRLLLAANGALAGLTVDVEDAASVKAAAALVAEDLMTYYPGDTPGEVPGILSQPPPDGQYYWWAGAALWGALLDYRSRTGETKYDSDISQGLIWQMGPNSDYMPPNWTATMGNDDQAIWGLSALDAQEVGLQEPSQDNSQWLRLAQNVFDDLHFQDRRVENGDCKGALRWQIYEINNGYDYISSAANIYYFNLAAQLAYLTGNKTYEDAASDTFELLEDIGLISKKYDVYDGTHVSTCGDINKAQFSSNAAMLLQGSAFMYNHTNGDDDWKERVDGLVSRTLEVFFPNGVAFEVACEKTSTCNTDMIFYKSLLHRGLGSTIEIAPYTSATILPVLKTSAKSAAAQCTAGSSGRLCGFQWASGKFNGTTGPAQQMGVLSALTSILPAQGSITGNGSSSTNTTTSGSSSGTSQGSTSSDTPAGSAATRTAVTFGAMMIVVSQLLGGVFI